MNKRIAAAVLSGMIGLTAVFTGGYQFNEKVYASGVFRMHVIDVGFGTGVLLQSGTGTGAKYALIDAGPKTSLQKGGKTTYVGKRVRDYLIKNHVKHLEFVILSHPHKDHVGGMISILQDKSISIGKIYANQNLIYNHYEGNKDLFRDSAMEEVEKLIQERKIMVTAPKVGDVLYLGNAKLTFYAPAKLKYSYVRKTENLDGHQINKCSIVTRVTFGSNSFLITGDTQQINEKEMMKNKKLPVHSQVLVVPHHGYADGYTKKGKTKVTAHKTFFDKVAPVVSIVSNGAKNPKSLPKKEVVNELAQSSLYTTGTSGTVIVTSDGKTLSVITKKKKQNIISHYPYDSSGKQSRSLNRIKAKYKKKSKKSFTFSFRLSARSCSPVKNVYCQLVKKGKKISGKRWKKGKKIKVKKGFYGNVYVRIQTSIGMTIVKSHRIGPK